MCPRSTVVGRPEHSILRPGKKARSGNPQGMNEKVGQPGINLCPTAAIIGGEENAVIRTGENIIVANSQRSDSEVFKPLLTAFHEAPLSVERYTPLLEVPAKILVPLTASARM